MLSFRTEHHFRSPVANRKEVTRDEMLVRSSPKVKPSGDQPDCGPGFWTLGSPTIAGYVENRENLRAAIETH